jgi:hypothetical protein
MRIALSTASIAAGLALQTISSSVLAQTYQPYRCAQPPCPPYATGPALSSEPPIAPVPAVTSRRDIAADVAVTPPVATNGAAIPTNVPTTGTRTFGGLTLGVGIGATFDTQGQRRVISATPVNNIVRVTQTDNATVSLVGESHYFFVPNIPLFSVPAGDWGHGPFVAIDAGTNNNGNLISGYSIGWMIGFRQPSWTWTPSGWAANYSTSSWNFGVGFRVDPNAQVLGDGVVANQLLPPGETTVRLKTEARYGVMLLSSFSF